MIKNASPWHSSTRTFTSKRNYLLVLAFTLLVLTLNSCKKDIYNPIIPASDKANSPIKTISYSDFLQKVNLNQVGVLKTSLVNAKSTGNGKLMSANSGISGFDIDTDSVKKLTLGDTVSYVISLKPETKHAVQFRNITIQTVNGQTIAFLTTYLPTQEFIKAWKTDKKTPFKGEIYANKISLETLPEITVLNSKNQSANGKVMSTSANEILINHNKISLAPGECEIYDVYVVAPRPCSTGDMPGSCQWESDGLTLADVIAINGPGAHLPYYTLERSTVVNCAPMGPIGGGGTGGGTGGGSTTPNPPGGYDPCDGGGNIPTASYRAPSNGLKLMGVPPSPCDNEGDGSLPPVEPINPFEVESLISLLDLTGNEYNFITNNPNIAIELYNLMSQEQFSLEARRATEMTIKASALNILSTSNYNLQYSAIGVLLPNSQNIDAQQMGIYFSIYCAMIKAENPTYSMMRVYWEASKEMVHLALDGVGLVPGAGEIADLTNGLLYSIEGDGVNATLSFASAIPFVGWASTGAKYAKKTLNLADGTKTSLIWAKKAGNLINFGNRGQLRKVLGLVAGDSRQAHHIIPWGKQAHQLIQKAAKKNGLNPFHMNDALNGIAIAAWRNQPNHNVYDNLIKTKLDALPSNLTPNQAYDEVLNILNHAKQAIINNPNTHLNDLIF